MNNARIEKMSRFMGEPNRPLPPRGPVDKSAFPENDFFQVDGVHQPAGHGDGKQVGFAMHAANGLRMDAFLAKRAHPAMNVLVGQKQGFAVLAFKRFIFDFPVTEGTFAAARVGHCCISFDGCPGSELARGGRD
jgi:hypothetical protein